MKITCHSCQSKYTVSDEKVQGKTVKIKCRKCGTTILVNAASNGAQSGDASVSTSAAALGGEGGGEASFLVNVTEGDQRTMSLAEVVEAYNNSTIDSETYVWTDGMADWVPLGQCDAIVNALHAAASQPETAAAPVAQAAAPAPEASRPAAVKRDQPRRSADLFGSSGSDDVATSAPLFSASSFSGGGGLGSSPSVSGSRSPAGGGGGSGAGPSAAGVQAREENSVLFSLSALTSKAAAPAASSASRASSRNTEDSGIIDLKALAEAGSAPVSAVSVASALPDAGLFNLPAAPMPVAAPVYVAPEIAAPPKSRTGLILGMMAILTAGAIGGAFVFMNRADDDKVKAEAAASAAAQPTTPVATTPVAQGERPAVESTPTATATATATAAAVAAKAPAGGGKAAPAKTSSGGTQAAAPATPPAAAEPPKAKPNKCGCAPGDLMCAMKCSTK